MYRLCSRGAYSPVELGDLIQSPSINPCSCARKAVDPPPSLSLVVSDGFRFYVCCVLSLIRLRRTVHYNYIRILYNINGVVIASHTSTLN